MRSRLTAALGGALLAAFALPALAGASTIAGAVDSYAKEQYAVSTNGWFLEAMVRNIPDPAGGTFGFRAHLVRAQGTVQGNGPQRPGEPDLRQAWVSLVEEREGARNPATPGLPPHAYTVCSNFANPASSGGIDDVDARSVDVYADVTCRDGRGYDFYRVHWDFHYRGYDVPASPLFAIDRPLMPVGNGTRIGQTPSTPNQVYGPMGWGATAVSADWTYGGSIGGVVWWDTDGGPARTVTFRICGHRGTQVECLKPDPVYQFGKAYDPTWVNGAKLSPMETEARRGEPDIR